VGASVHHDDTVSGAKKDFRLADGANAIVRDAVKEKDPAAIGVRRTDEPAAEGEAVGSLDREVLALGMGDCEGGVGFANEIGSEFAAERMEIGRADEPAGDGGKQRRKEQ